MDCVDCIAGIRGECNGPQTNDGYNCDEHRSELYNETISDLEEKNKELAKDLDEMETQKIGAYYTAELYERILTACTRHLDHYPLACGCNGLLVVDKHLENIMDERLELLKYRKGDA